MAANRPDDLNPEAWFEAVVRIDQAHATNAAFRASVQPRLAVPEVISTELLPPPWEIAEEPLATPRPEPHFPEVLNIKGMSADDIREFLLPTDFRDYLLKKSLKTLPHHPQLRKPLAKNRQNGCSGRNTFQSNPELGQRK